MLPRTFFRQTRLGLELATLPHFFGHRGIFDAGMPLDHWTWRCSATWLVKLVISPMISYIITLYLYPSIYPSISYDYWWSQKKGLGNHQINHGGKVEPSLAKAFRRAFEGFREWDLVRLPNQPLFWLMWIDEDSKILLRENVLRYNSIVYIYDYMIIYDIWLYIHVWCDLLYVIYIYVVCSVYILYTYYINTSTEK
jgi:hypothetical protein